MKSPILLAGAGGHARSCIDVIEEGGLFDVVGLIGLPHEVGGRILGRSVLGTDKDLSGLASNYPNALVSVGQIKTPEPRRRLFELLEQCGFELPAVVSPHAHVSRHATLGAGTIVMHGAVVNAEAVVGKNCIINSLALVEHDAVVADHCHVATSAAINSGAKVGVGTFIGSGSTVRQGIEIGERCVIGMGQRVVSNIASETWIPSPRGPK